jgi:hypothetical protein
MTESTTPYDLRYECMPVLRCAACTEDRPHALSYRNGPTTHHQCLACGTEQTS